jgi:hypothetical protein
MMSPGCASFGFELGPFLDRELDGIRMLRLSRHLDECPECASALADMAVVGESLRSGVGVGDDVSPVLFNGFASTVVTRSRAESSVSWRNRVTQGCDDWHWTIVGVGSIAATFVSTSLLSLILAFGPAPQRDDSLSALMTNLGSPAGFLFVYASTSDGQDSELVQVDNGRPPAPRMVSDLVVSQAHQTAPDAELLTRYQELVVRHGRIVSHEDLSAEQRLVADALLDEIIRLTLSGRRSFGPVNVHEMRLVTSTGVSAKQS